jgi:ubiquinone/menaquinone biosynthesis C-methylase UbiE
MDSINSIFIHKFIEKSLEIINLDKDSKILDIGCGDHKYSVLYENNSSHLVNIDINEGKKKLDCISNAHHLCFKSNSFDLILFCEVFEHLYNPLCAISEIERLLKKGGFAIITWPFMHHIHDIPNDFFRMTEFGFERMITNFSLSIEKFQRRGNIFSLIQNIAGYFISALLEKLILVPVLGKVFKPIAILSVNIIGYTYKLNYLVLKNSKGVNPSKIGSSLNGPMGKLALWPVGYCALLRKI